LASEITPERVVATAGELDHDEFTRNELAAKLGVSIQDLKPAVKAARQAGRIEKVRENAEGKGVFRLTASAESA
jgi:DNA-binding MarR family transcriptional regulator